MTLLAAATAAHEPTVDTQPFAFVGHDAWGHPVRGRIVAADSSSARGELRTRGIAPAAVTEDPGDPAPYTVELAVAGGARSLRARLLMLLGAQRGHGLRSA